MRKKLLYSLALSGITTLSFAGGIYAGSAVESIQAYLNKDIKFTIDKAAWVPKDPDGQILAPIVYGGSSYLPVRALAEATGMEIDWDAATNTIQIETKRTESSVLPNNNVPNMNPASDVPNSIVNFMLKDENKLNFYDYVQKVFWLKTENPGQGIVENQKLVFDVGKQDFKTMVIRYLANESDGWHTYHVKDQDGNEYPIENASQSYTYQGNAGNFPPVTINAWQGTVRFNKGPVTRVYLYYAPLSEKHSQEGLLADSYFSK
ncbi:stalk domain-containing protein [Paenibacillus chartarius]|uniref:Stalk domain-containing protein n=1 Tax=Paenibacillus chartarius TaxID=747481 RepID=A0ABV6DSK0_9BACL